ncbi:hypothetical protein Dcar01_00991 [Deinococcus carri]|uniref:Uncharacterized protein n=1 Tax=Deinococcus carri TaxID=1211323 RepID=A0ABP9W4I9_9DEIO
MLDLVRRPFGFASALAAEAHTFTTPGNVSPTSDAVLRDQLQLMREEIRRQYVRLSNTDLVWHANVISTYKDLRTLWLDVWGSTPPYLLTLACFDWFRHVQGWSTEAQAAVENLWRFAAPIALKVSVEAAPQFSSWSEAFSFVASGALEVIHRWRPRAGITFLKYFEEASRAELPKGVAFLRGRGQQLDQRLRTVWAARAALLAYGVDPAMITPALVLREIASQYTVKQEQLPRHWNLKLVTELLESQQYAPMWSLDHSSEDDDRLYGDTLASELDVESRFETTLLHREASIAARALARAGLWETAMSISLKELLEAAESGTPPLDAFCHEHHLNRDNALEIVSLIGHLTLWAD